MYKSEVLEHFSGNGAEVARQLGVMPSAVYQWGPLIPEKQAARLDRMTGGKLQYRPELYEPGADRSAA